VVYRWQGTRDGLRKKEAYPVIAAKLFKQGQMEDGQIAALLEAITRALSKKRKAFPGGRPPGVVRQRAVGGTGLLDTQQCPHLRQLLGGGAKAYRFAAGKWIWGSQMLK
jgi:hypothetical protein